jgi:hypothetical protein
VLFVEHELKMAGTGVAERGELLTQLEIDDLLEDPSRYERPTWYWNTSDTGSSFRSVQVRETK